MVRTLEQLRPVLKNPELVEGPDPVYEVVEAAAPWVNKTIIAPGKLGEEFTKTFGHYHPQDAPVETYEVVSGAGVLQLQKGMPGQVEEVVLVRAKPGDQIKIPEEYGHSWSNVGSTPLVLLDDWSVGHTPADYEPLEETHGMAYYLVEENGQTKAVANPNYKNLPEPVWMTAEEFKMSSQSLT